jgi:hypothetical protein
MADLVDHFADFADAVLRPRTFSERRLAPDSLTALKAAITFALAAVGILLLGTHMTATDRASPGDTVRMSAIFIPQTIPMAALLYLFQKRRGIDFLQCLAIFVLLLSYALTAVGISSFLFSLKYAVLATIPLQLYAIVFAAPQMLVGITKTSYGAALGAVLAAFAGGWLIFSLIGALAINLFN